MSRTKHVLTAAKKFKVEPAKLISFCKQVQDLLIPMPHSQKILTVIGNQSRLDLGKPYAIAKLVSAKMPEYQLRESVETENRLKAEVHHDRSTTILQEKASLANKRSPTNKKTLDNSFWLELAQALGLGVSTDEARQFYENMKIVIPVANHCSPMMILRAVKRCKNNQINKEITMGELELELRKLRYGYKHDPDEIRIVSVPMGGKPSK